MHVTPFRDASYKRELLRTIEEIYGIAGRQLLPASSGYYGETWKLCTAEESFFLKLDYLPYHQAIFERGLSVVAYLCSQGLDFVGEVVPTKEGKLSASFHGAVLGVFRWLEGENVETDATKAPEYQLLCQVYQHTRPGLPLPSAEFSSQAALTFFENWQALEKDPVYPGAGEILALLEENRSLLEQRRERLDAFARRCGKEPGDCYITHGDAGGNFFVGKGKDAGKNFLVDWDEAMYAPLERDAWVMGCYPWARELFNNTLRRNNIPYELRLDRLGFYSYHMFFFYLNEFLSCLPFWNLYQRIEDYFENGWILERLQFADTL